MWRFKVLFEVAFITPLSSLYLHLPRQLCSLPTTVPLFSFLVVFVVFVSVLS